MFDFEGALLPDEDYGYRALFAYTLFGETNTLSYHGRLESQTRENHFMGLAARKYQTIVGKPAPAESVSPLPAPLSGEAYAMGMNVLMPGLWPLFQRFAPAWGQPVLDHPELPPSPPFVTVSWRPFIQVGPKGARLIGANFALSLPERVLAMYQEGSGAGYHHLGNVAWGDPLSNEFHPLFEAAAAALLEELRAGLAEFPKA